MKPDPSINQMIHNMITNQMLERSQLLKFLMDTKYDINAECGYPTQITIQQYVEMYSRVGVGRRVVTVFPEEMWAIEPEIYEDEDPGNKTEFEAALEVMSDTLLQTGVVFDDGKDQEVGQITGITAYLQKIDELSGVGSFGLLLLGLDDGRKLSEPVEGMDEATGKRNPSAKKLNLLFLRAFHEGYVSVEKLEDKPTSPRFGQPVSYKIRFQQTPPPGDSVSAMSSALEEISVHWSRVIHVADNTQSSEIFGSPRLEPVYNHVYDIRKILGADGEGCWRGGFQGISFETHPNLENVEFTDEQKEYTKEQIEQFQSGFQRYLTLIGMTARPLGSQVADPASHVDTQIGVICMAIGVPMRVFKGSEEAKLASSQDMRTWNKRLKKRQTFQANPRIIRPFIDRMILYGCLPRPKKRYKIYWADLNAPTDNDRAVTAAKETDAISKYVTTGASKLIRPREFLVHTLKKTPAEAAMILKAAGNADNKEIEIPAPPAPPGGGPTPGKAKTKPGQGKIKRGNDDSAP